MSEAAESFVRRLSGLEQSDWDEAVREILPSVHPIDQPALQIWFRFWPLRLCRALEKSSDPQKTAREMELDGGWELGKQIDSSISFFYGSRYWAEVKQAVLEQAQATFPDALSEQIRQAARQAAGKAKAGEDLALGVTAAALMTLRQVGVEALSAVASRPAQGPVERKSPEKVLQMRRRKSGGLLNFLKGGARSYRVRWEERNPQAVFQAMQGQDLSSAAGADQHDYLPLDPRRKEGPVPAQCRSAACGYCWIGILGGRENLSELTPFEQRRLHYFGYHPRDAEPDPHPYIRLACQSKCQGDVTLVVPPWNGVIDGKR